MIKSINKMYYQKYLPGDIVEISSSMFDGNLNGIGMITKCKCNNNYEFFHLDNTDELRTHYINLNNINISSRLIYRRLNKTSDYYCKWVCKDKDNCELCNYRIENFIPSDFFFTNDKVYQKKLGYGKIYEAGVLVFNIFKYIEKSSLHYQDIWIDLVEEFIDKSKICYRVYLDELKRSETLLAEDLKLYHRRGFTLDNDINQDFCNQCIYQDCSNCGIISDSIKQKLIEL